MSLDHLFVIFAGLLGLLVGSFTNVLIWRLPRGESIAFPPSHCPKCGHPLAVIDLIPLFSWLSLGGKCRYCKEPISARYPIIELISGIGYFVIAAMFPFGTYGFAPLGLMILLTILLAGSAIDLDTYTLPDALTLSGVAFGLLFAMLNERMATEGFPTLAQAMNGALMGAGLLVTIDLIGSWILRRFQERQYPEQPLGYQQISLALLAGAWLGTWTGLGIGLLSAMVNLTAHKVIRIPELITLLGFFISIVIASNGIGPGLIVMIQDALSAAGATALVAGVYWWIQNARNTEDEEDDDQYDPSAMGFGDVKLAAAIGAFLGWEKLLLTILVAVVTGLIGGLIQSATKSDNRVKFGPFLAIGAVVAIFFGSQLMEMYKGMLGM